MTLRTRCARVAAFGVTTLLLTLLPAADGAGEIRYRTLFQDPGVVPAADFSLEAHAIGLIESSPPGSHITIALRDFNRVPVADALIAAHGRGVLIDAVIDGQERNRAVVRRLLAALGPEHFVVCGTPTFAFNSCIADVGPPSLQHNKFLTFSRLADGREHVVLQTSENFFEPTQFNYYNDMVEISGDVALYDAYVEYLHAMQAQVRSDDHYVVRSGDDGRNTMFPSPRRQADLSTDDTIVDRMDEIDCSEGGSPSGRGLIRIANMAFRSARAVIMRKLVELHGEGCDIDVVVSSADGDIIAGLVAAGVPVHPLFLRQTATRPQVIVHDKFWVVDAKSTLTGRRTKVAYAGSSNWRDDQQRSDDLLLRIVDDGVYADYLAYWETIRSRAVSDLPRTGEDATPAVTALAATPAPGASSWNTTDVTARIAASDGHLASAGGLDRLHIETTGAQPGTFDFPGEQDGYNVQELTIAAEGETTIAHTAFDVRGNLPATQTAVVRIDKTAPVLAGLPDHCVLWPPNGRLVRVAGVSAADAVSGLGALSVTASSNARRDTRDVVIKGGTVFLRAERRRHGRGRVYEIVATAHDVAGNATTATATCTVPRSRHRGAGRGIAAGPE